MVATEVLNTGMTAAAYIPALIETLTAIQAKGAPEPLSVRKLPSGQLVAKVGWGCHP